MKLIKGLLITVAITSVLALMGVDATIGKTVNFGNKSKEAGLYRILLKAKRSTASQVRYWGTWVY